MASAWKALPLLLTMGVIALSCALLPSAGEATVYMACRGEGEACSDGTKCLTLVCCFGSQCAAECVEDSDCPGLAGFEPACEIFTNGRYCAIRCAGEDAPCPDNFTCTSVDRRNGTSGFLCL